MSQIVSPSAPAKGRTSWHAAALPVGVALSLGAAVTLWYATRVRAPESPPPAVPAAASAGQGASTTATTATTPEPAEITLHVTATPPGTVTIDGAGYGETPVAVKLPRSDQRRTLRVAKAGFDTYEQPIVLDADQRHVVTLLPGRSSAPARPPSIGPTRAPSPSVTPTPAPPSRPEIL